MNIWFQAIRINTLVTTIIPIIMGSILSFKENKFHFLSMASTFLAAIFIQIGTNFANDYFDYKNGDLPYFALGWEDLFLKSNPVERAIYTMHYQERAREQVFKDISNVKGGKISPTIIEIPFEHFVKKPGPYLEQICAAASTMAGRRTKIEMRRQRVPRANIADGIPLSIYKRCGWVPPEKGISEAGEYEKRRKFVMKEGVSKASLKILDKLCEKYSADYSVY